VAVAGISIVRRSQMSPGVSFQGVRTGTLSGAQVPNAPSPFFQAESSKLVLNQSVDGGFAVVVYFQTPVSLDAFGRT